MARTRNPDNAIARILGLFSGFERRLEALERSKPKTIGNWAQRPDSGIVRLKQLYAPVVWTFEYHQESQRWYLISGVEWVQYRFDPVYRNTASWGTPTSGSETIGFDFCQAGRWHFGVGSMSGATTATAAGFPALVSPAVAGTKTTIEAYNSHTSSSAFHYSNASAHGPHTITAESQIVPHYYSGNVTTGFWRTWLSIIPYWLAD